MRFGLARSQRVGPGVRRGGDLSSVEHPGASFGRSWTGELDAALAELVTPRPLRDTVDRLLDHALDAAGATDGYVILGAVEQQALRVSSGRGRWAVEQPATLDEAVRAGGSALVLPSDPERPEELHLAVPIVVEEGVVGSMGVSVRAEIGARTAIASDAGAPDVELLARFAALVAVAYSGARMITTERDAREQEKALIRSGRALSSTLELRDVLSRILSELRKVVPYDTASVQELRGDQMVIVGGMGIDMDVFAGVGFDVQGDGVPNADVLRRCEPVIVSDILGDHPYPQFPHDAHETSGVRGWLGVPLMFGTECIGMITLDTFEVDFYDDDHADTALAFASQAAIALQNARSFGVAQREVAERRKAEEELRRANADLRARMAEIESLQADLRHQAERDALTGLYNRRYLVDVLPSEVNLATLAGRPLVLVMIDVDRFKEINDTLGHAAGDAVLMSIGSLLGDRTRPGDVACRYGGEEFVVVMPGVDLAGASTRVEAWRREVAATEVVGVAGVDGVSVTISLGVAELQSGDGAEDLLRRADLAMYRAKNAGRNRVVLARS